MWSTLKDFYENTRNAIDKYNQIQDDIKNLPNEISEDDNEFLQNFCIHLAHALIKDTGYCQVFRDELLRVADIIIAAIDE